GRGSIRRADMKYLRPSDVFLKVPDRQTAFAMRIDSGDGRVARDLRDELRRRSVDVDLEHQLRPRRAELLGGKHDKAREMQSGNMPEQLARVRLLEQLGQRRLVSRLHDRDDG